MEQANAISAKTKAKGLANKAWPFLFLIVLALAIALRLTTRAVPYRTPDEQIYIANATRIAASGPAAVSYLVKQFNETTDFWVFPPPTRIGFTFVVAAAMKLTGASAEWSAVGISFCSSLFVMVLTGLLGWRIFNRWIGLVAMALLSANPLDLAMARRVWQDETVAALGTLLLYFCVAATSGRRSRWWLGGFWILGAWFLLVKESALIIYGLLALWLVIDAWRTDQGWKKACAIAAVSAFVAVVSLSALVWISGGPAQFFQVYPHMAQALRWNDYVFLYQWGPWYSFPLGLWILAPAVTLLCLCGMVSLFLRANTVADLLELDNDQLAVAFGMAFFIGAILVAATLPQGYKCLRYVSVLEAPAALLAAMFLVYLVRRFSARPGMVLPCLGAVFVMLVALADYRRFQDYMGRQQLADLPVVQVIDAAFVPKEKPSTPPSAKATETDHRSGATQVTGTIVEATPEALLALSRQLYQRGSYNDAIAMAQRALKIRPDYAEAWNNIGAAYNAQNQFAEGMAACEKALALKPDFPLARANLAFARQKLREQPSREKK